MSTLEIMEEVKKAEKTARDFLENKLETSNPTPDQMDIMTRIVISNNGTMTLDELLVKTKAVLLERGFYHPEKERLLDWMLSIATNKSKSLVDILAGVTQVTVSPDNGLGVN